MRGIVRKDQTICDLVSARIPPAHRVYAIGDIHGHAQLAERMIDMIVEDVGHASHDVRCTVVGLGDYVDRGPQSAKVLDLLTGLETTDRLAFAWLKGNHEDLLLRFLDQPEHHGFHWLDIGGRDTLMSYGVTPPPGLRREQLRGLRDALAAELPLSHLLFLQRLRLSLTFGDFFFCHAGARPGVPLSEQRAEDLLWIRDGFADADAPFEKVVVHGHTPVLSPEVRHHRVNVDTCAFLTGTLSCAVFDSAGWRLLQATARSPKAPMPATSH